MHTNIVTTEGVSGRRTDRRPRVAPKALEQIEHLWGSVFFSTDRHAPRKVIVTGAEPKEGATQVAMALALVGASGSYGCRVALVDFNLRQPAIARRFGVPQAPGVFDVLTGGEMPAGTRVAVAEGQLTILPAGEPRGTTIAALEPTRVEKLLDKLLQDHEHVIIDAPSVNRNPAVQSLAGLTDGILLVAREGVTRREAVAEAKKRIELAHGKLIGLVLNRRTFPVPGFLYRRM